MPGTWIRNRAASKELSDLINNLLDNPKVVITIMSKYVANVGGVNLWIENYPYSYGCVYSLSYLYLGELAVLEPKSKEWESVYLKMSFEEALCDRFKHHMPDRETVFRLHEAVQQVKERERGLTKDPHQTTIVS